MMNNPPFLILFLRRVGRATALFSEHHEEYLSCWFEELGSLKIIRLKHILSQVYLSQALRTHYFTPSYSVSSLKYGVALASERIHPKFSHVRTNTQRVKDRA